MKWIAISERTPTREDGDENGNVVFRWSDGSTVATKWKSFCTSATHFARLRDIELPPAPPEMPERLEFVRLPKPAVAELGDLVLDGRGELDFASVSYTYNHVSLYRRVEPKPRIVFEVVDGGKKREPIVGERYITESGGSRDIAKLEYAGSVAPRTILRCVEGEEYLK